MEQVQDADGLGEVGPLGLPQRPLVIEQADHRAVVSQVAGRQLGVAMAGQALLGRDLDAADLPGHLGPDVLVLRPGPLLGLLVTKYLVDDVLGGPHERIDRVDRPDAGHLLLVRLLALGPTVVGLRSLLRRSSHGHPLAVGGDDQQRSPLGGWRDLQRRLEGRGVPRRGPVHPLQRPGPQPQPQEHLHRQTGLGERLLQAESFAPVLQDVGEVALGQAQPLIEGDVLDLLTLPGAVGRPGDGQLAEDRDLAAVVSLGQSADDLPLGGLGLWPQVPVALHSDEGRQQGMSLGQRSLDQAPLHGVDPLALVSGVPHEVPEGIELLLGLEDRLLRGDDHGEVSWCSDIGCVETDDLPQRDLIFHTVPP